MVNEMEIKDAIRYKLMEVYDKKGLTDTINAGYELMALCEKNAYQEKYRLLKGEIAEVILECELIELQKQSKEPSIILKGLCIPFRNSNSTTELDVTLITEKRIFLFECKSYSKKPKITDKCLLDGTMDVYKQSTLHLHALHDYISSYYNKSIDQKPYRFILFEMSTLGVDDQREDKKTIPVLNPKTCLPYLTDEYHKLKSVWDMNGLLKVLIPLSNNSDEMFKKHLERMKNRGKSHE